MLLALGPHRFDVTYRALVVGILQRTLGSSSGRGVVELLAEAETLVGAGADCLHIGSGDLAGRPGPEVNESEEGDRLSHAVQALRSRVDVPVWVATSSGSVAGACFAEGAVVADDASGFADPAFLPAAALAGATVVVADSRVRPGEVDPDASGHDPVADVVSFLTDRVRRAVDAGTPTERILVDAGIGVGKTGGQSSQVLRHLDRFAGLGGALCLTADTAPFLDDLPGARSGAQGVERQLGIDAAHALGIAQGVRVLRTHDVRAGRRVADTMACLLETRATVRAERQAAGDELVAR